MTTKKHNLIDQRLQDLNDDGVDRRGVLLAGLDDDRVATGDRDGHLGSPVGQPRSERASQLRAERSAEVGPDEAGLSGLQQRYDARLRGTPGLTVRALGASALDLCAVADGRLPVSRCSSLRSSISFTGAFAASYRCGPVSGNGRDDPAIDAQRRTVGRGR